MNDKVQGLEILDETIARNLRHEDYERVTELAQEYYDIFTGENLATYLKRIVERESEEAFKQRCTIYNSAIPSTVANLLKLFNKPLRSNRIFRSIELKNVNAYNEIIERVNKFYQGESESGVDAYLIERWKYLTAYDPNAYIAVEFGDFNNLIEKAYPFPLEYSSAEMINLKYINGTLDWCIAMLDHHYKSKADDTIKKGHRFLMYLDDVVISLKQVDDKTTKDDELEGELHTVYKEKGVAHSKYDLEYFDIKSKGVALFRAGYEPDPNTKGRTTVSIIHSSLPFFKKELKSGSELDIVMAMHAFPIRVQWGDPCKGHSGKQCLHGREPNGKTCEACGGSGMQNVATSSQSIVYLRRPKNNTEPLPDPDKAFVYKTPPAEFIQFLDNYVDKLTKRAKAAVFNVESLERADITKTATETEYSYENYYDTLMPFCSKYSYAWLFIVRKIAIYTGNDTDDLVLYHQFPKDFKLKGLTTLLAEAKTAKESGLNQHAVAAINNDILEAMYSDDQDTLTRIKVKNKFQPFSGKTKEEIALIINDVLPYYKTLYIYHEAIFSEIDNTMGDAFYLKPYNQQLKIVQDKVEAIEKEAEKLKAKSFKSFLSNQEIVEDGQEEEQTADT